MLDLAPIAHRLLQQTRSGQRQLTTAAVLAHAREPLDRQTLMQRVEAALGRPCYGTRPEHTLWADVRALKRAGLPIRYTRAARRPGYYLLTQEQVAQQQAMRRLRQIGWQPADWTQITVYARMPPARKVAQMLRLRRTQIRLLEARLRHEHPAATPIVIARLVQEHLALVREPLDE
jgi:hypothetical protein